MQVDVWKLKAAERRRFLKDHRGFLSMVSRRLDPPVSRTAVILVWHKRGTSQRIKAAIEAEMQAILEQENRQQ